MAQLAQERYRKPPLLPKRIIEIALFSGYYITPDEEEIRICEELVSKNLFRKATSEDIEMNVDYTYIPL